MKNDRKAIGGFMESMVAVMAVTVALTVFIGMFAYVQFNENQIDADDYRFAEKLYLENGKITGDVREDLIYLAETNGYSMVELKVSAVGTDLEFYDSFGETKTENVRTQEGTFTLNSDDGRKLVAKYEVVMWK